MRLLPDTRAVLWWLADDPALSPRARDLLESGRHEVLLSAVVALEISIKAPLGKLDVPGDATEVLLSAGAHELPITTSHARRVRDLPLHHRDPFDRVLVAQALEEDAVVLSIDAALDGYGVRRRW